MVIDGATRAPDLADVTDDELMRRYQGGDQRAFREIVARHAGLVRSIARRQLRAEADAKDVVAQTFLQLHRARADYKGGDKLRAWIATIASNLVKMHFRARGRRPEVQEPELVEATEGASFDAQIDQADTRRQVRRALATLPAAQREVIELHWFEQLSFSEIAETVGASLSAVKVRAHRGYERLRSTLKSQEAA